MDGSAAGLNLSSNQMTSLMIPVQQAQTGSAPHTMYFNQLPSGKAYPFYFVALNFFCLFFSFSVFTTACCLIVVVSYVTYDLMQTFFY